MEKIASLNENNLNVTNATQMYNLRKKTVQKYNQHSDDDHNFKDSRRIQKTENLSFISNASFSETSSKSTSSDDEYLDIKPNISLIPKIRTTRKPPVLKSVSKRYNCKFCAVKREFKKKQVYETHLSLHSKGNFPCQFCSKIQPNVILGYY